MRWEGLLVSGADEARATPPLPLALPGAVARTFDTPGFAGMTFYEIRAKSIINRVPSRSRMPFQWTINPYRGCSHACVYCLSGDTPVLMADGRTRPLAELSVGDRIYGTMREGHRRRYAVTEVRAHWMTLKPAFRITLRDGTTLIASGDHRLLGERGWRFVTRLTPGAKLRGTGQFAPPPKDSEEYHRGYLCGLIRCAGHLGSYTYAYATVHQFRLAMFDVEALDRARAYLAGAGVPTRRTTPRHSSASRRPKSAIRTQSADAVAAVSALVAWPASPTVCWRQGLLAGVFDAVGEHRRSGLHIVEPPEEVGRWVGESLARLGFDAVHDGAGLRITGGLAQRLRFFHSVDPAVTRKRTIDGVVVGLQPGVEVVSIEDLGLELPMYDITTGTGDFIANGIVSHNCFARGTHSYLDLDTGRDFDSRIVVKVNAGELLRKELAAPRWRGEHIAMGTNVDCYQRAEGRYGLMREILAGLRDHANPFSILTKGTLITRDLDLLTQAADVTQVGISVSIGFLDEALWRSVEPGTPSPRRRLDTVRQLADAGFAVGVLMAPILPGLTDTDESIDATVRAIAAAGAASVVPISLHLRPGAREWYLAWLARQRPELLPRYQALYGRRAYLPSTYQREIAARVRLFAGRYGLRRERPAEHRRVAAPAATPPRPPRSPGPPGPPGPEPGEQLTLL